MNHSRTEDFSPGKTILTAQLLNFINSWKRDDPPFSSLQHELQKMIKKNNNSQQETRLQGNRLGVFWTGKKVGNRTNYRIQTGQRM